MLEYVRWVMVRKRDAAAPAPDAGRRRRRRRASRRRRSAPPARRSATYDFALAGSPHRFGDYEAGERIDHVDGVTVEEADHMLATRLYQNTAKVHFNQFSEGQGRFGRRLIYGGHVISLARALSFNGLANAFHVAAINGGRHVAPLFAGDTVFAWSEILEKAELPGRTDVGALRVRLVATKNRPCADFPYRERRRLRAQRRPRFRHVGPDPEVARCACRPTQPCIIGAGAEPELEQVWREERLPVVTLGADLSGLEAALEGIGTATVVACGEGAARPPPRRRRWGFAPSSSAGPRRRGRRHGLADAGARRRPPRPRARAMEGGAGGFSLAASPAPPSVR